MRRLAVLTLVTAVATAVTLGLTAAPASAHICPIAVEIPVAQPSTIDVGVTVEGATIPDVEITIPAGLRLDRVDPKQGWTFTRTGTPTGTPDGSTVRYRGGPIAPYTCEYFSLGVTAPTREAFGIPVVQRTADGKVWARSTPDASSAQSRVLDQFVYAGEKPPAIGGGSSSLSTTTIAGIALVGLGVVSIGVLGFRAWRNRGLDEGDDETDGDDETADHETAGDAGDREAELQARLEQFRKRTRDPPPRR
ncbi:MAG TPA: hypothetical protein VIJ48_06595 [Acidimicrobiia bacterium]